MSQFTITPMDGGLVVLVILGVQALKKYVFQRWIPLLPFIVSWLLMIPAVIVAHGGVPSGLVFLSQVFLEGLKVAILSMATYKIQHTTVLGKRTDNHYVKKGSQMRLKKSQINP